MEKYTLIDRTGHHILGTITSDELEVLTETLQLEHAADTDFYLSMDAIDALRERDAELAKMATALTEEDPSELKKIPERGKELVKQYEAITLHRETEQALEAIGQRREVIARLSTVFERAVQQREDAKKEAAKKARALEATLNAEINELKQSLQSTRDAEKIDAIRAEIDEREERLKKAYKDVGDLTGIDVQWTQRTYTHAINMEVRSATNLAKADIIGKSDPYALVEIINSEGTVLANSRTEYKPVELNPVWDHVCSFLVRSTDAIRVQIFDHDTVSSDDFLGHRTFVVKELTEGTPLEGSYKLDKAKSGEVQVWIELSELTPIGD